MNTAEELPKGDPKRLAIARQVQAARQRERSNNPYKVNRSGIEYLQGFLGLEHFLGYIRTLPSSIVLDIGGGKGIAALSLSNSWLGEGLQFKITSLKPYFEHGRFPKGHVHLTSAEILNGIENNSIGGVLAYYSFAQYGITPDLAVARIDQVLVPGGAIKTTLESYDNKPKIAGAKKQRLDNRDKILDMLHNFSYDSAIVYDDMGEEDVLLAIKPGGSGVKAAELLNRDKELDKKRFRHTGREYDQALAQYLRKG